MEYTWRRLLWNNHYPVTCYGCCYDAMMLYWSYDELLEKLWEFHDPTTLNRQGPDVGTQYRSAIFYLNEDQIIKAEASKEKLEQSNKYKNPVVTEISPASKFWPAEEYHQKYLAKKGIDIACHWLKCHAAMATGLYRSNLSEPLFFCITLSAIVVITIRK